MRKPIILIGEENTKRTDYMKQAAKEAGVLLHVLSWKELRTVLELPDSAADGQLYDAVVKIDPPPCSIVCLEQMQAYVSDYIRILQKLERMPRTYLNAPWAIARLLDKKESKKCLQEHGIPVTQMFDADIKTPEQLLEFLRQERCYSVFLKPRYFSGAAGAAAFRFYPASESEPLPASASMPADGRMALYTSCLLEGRQLINTKKMFRLQDKAQIFSLLERLLALECIIERWHPKANVHGKSYDLRIVYQFGHIAHIVVRCSNAPVTNLHLNNQALEVQALGLSAQAVRELEELCARAVRLFPGLNAAGIDVLLEKGTLQPRIIEMNGQGDLIYQDIYGENRIYREQVIELCRS